MKRWVALFSQSGTEIASLAVKLGFNPRDILTDRNNRHIWDHRIKSKVVVLDHESIEREIQRLHSIYHDDLIVTLHGYLRILSPDIVNKVEVWNSHPGDIINFPQLKGKDPQKRALELKLPHTGVVIHQCVAEVDAGPIHMYSRCNIDSDTNLPDLIDDLRDKSVGLWNLFLREKFK